MLNLRNPFSSTLNLHNIFFLPLFLFHIFILSTHISCRPTTLTAPPGSRFVADPKPVLKINLISARNLEAADLNGMYKQYNEILKGE